MRQDVTDMKQYVLDFVSAVRKRPALGSDPGELDNLEKAALTSWYGAYGAMNAPIAPDTFEARTILLSGSATSERVELEVPYACMIVGAYASLSILSSGAGSSTPTKDDIDVTLDLNAKDYRTSIQGNTTATSSASSGTPTRDGQFVTLAALATGTSAGARLLGWMIKSSTATIGVTYRWKQGANVFKDTIVSLSLYARELEG